MCPRMYTIHKFDGWSVKVLGVLIWDLDFSPIPGGHIGSRGDFSPILDLRGPWALLGSPGQRGHACPLPLGGWGVFEGERRGVFEEEGLYGCSG